MKTFKILLLSFSILINIYFVLKFVIIPWELKTHFKAPKRDENHWASIDTSKLIGEPQGSCLCVKIKDTIYKVNVYQKTNFTYTQQKK